jgi:bis(5'-nucleosyl)-tetraphosphatase (symmetrical)
MATYLIGDIQGCYDELQALLALCEFDAKRDHALFLGDLVNRGPQSLQVLQLVRGLGASATSLLGNHDLHLLAVAHGIRPANKSDTLSEILESPERDALLHWLRHQHMALHLPEHGLLCVHAGVLPQWSVTDTLAHAQELQQALRADDYVKFLQGMYGNEPAAWQDDLRGAERLRVIVNALTRLRFCSELDENGEGGVMEFKTKEGAAGAPQGYVPWFEVKRRATQNIRIAFGHWSTLGLLVDKKIVALDTGCVWGGALTALRLADVSTGQAEQIFQVPCVKGAAWDSVKA